jgi:hypothetical protein
MATTKPTTSRWQGARLRTFVRRHRAVTVAAVEGAALPLHLPLTVHVLLAVGAELAISLLTGRGRSG